MLQQYGTLEGEGFTITAIQCALIEFFAATVIGKSYRFLKNRQGLGPFEYNKSGDLFVDFLSSNQPFGKHFSRGEAEEFYGSIRCGLLHEAATKNGWRIRARSFNGVVIDQTRKIFFRDNFQALLNQFVREYGKRIQTDAALQDAFIRKYDKLAE